MGAIEDNAAGSAASLWVIVIQNLDITALPGLINAMILLSGMSCGKGHLYFSVHKLTSLTPEQRDKLTLSRRLSTQIPRQVHRIWRPHLLRCPRQPHHLHNLSCGCYLVFWMQGLEGDQDG